MKLSQLALITAFLMFASGITWAQDCREFYDETGGNGASRIEALTKFMSSTAEKLANSCRNGASTCASHLSMVSGKVVDGAVFNASVAKRLLIKVPTSPIAIATFSINQEKIRKTILSPITRAINERKDAEANIIRLKRGLVRPGELVSPTSLEKFTFGMFGKKKIPTEIEMVTLLEETIYESEVELWAHGYFSAGLIGLIGVPRLSGQVAFDIAGSIISSKDGQKAAAYNLAKKIIMTRLVAKFNERDDLAMMPRLGEAVKDAFVFDAKAEVLEARDAIYEEFGFDELLKAINRAPEVEAIQLRKSLGN